MYVHVTVRNAILVCKRLLVCDNFIQALLRSDQLLDGYEDRLSRLTFAAYPSSIVEYFMREPSIKYPSGSGMGEITAMSVYLPRRLCDNRLGLRQHFSEAESTHPNLCWLVNRGEYPTASWNESLGIMSVPTTPRKPFQRTRRASCVSSSSKS